MEQEVGWAEPLEQAPPLGPFETLQADREWVALHLRPWIRRRLRGESSGDGRVPKRPQVTPVASPVDPSV